jgi:hypothetical protein
MTIPENDKYQEYERYAEYCLSLAAELTDQDSRRIQREMAAEWLRLANEIRQSHTSKRRKMAVM